jgi:TolB-like protein/Tfp pilus assembly protein PilF
MGQDEAGTLAALKGLRTELIDLKIAEHIGRVFKSTGDGLLAEFPSVVNAVACAMEIQRDMQRRNTNAPEERAIRLRIGVNLGDIIVEDGDVFGDGVNVAARLESIAPPGGVAVSGTVRDHLGTRLDLHFEDIGEQMLKNIDRPIRVYVVGGGAPSGSYPKLPDKPSIAVLPFENMSGDAEQEYFADGVVEEIITALSRFRQLFVIARNSTFVYKGRGVDVKQIGRNLGVRYVLEGSVRKSEKLVRIAGQLIDTATGAHLWADRFEGELENIFDVQDQVTERVVGAIAPKVEEAEIERTKHKPTDSLDAYDHFLRGMASLHKWTREGNYDALSHFIQAIKLDPNYAAAHGLAARTYVQRFSGGWATDRTHETAEMEKLADKAVELSRDDAVALCTAGFALSELLSRIDDGDALIDKALSLNPNLAWAWLYSGWVKAALGQSDISLDRMKRAQRLSPNDPQKFSLLAGSALAHLYARQFEDAYSAAQAAMRERSAFLLAICIAGVSAAHLGRITDAKMAVMRILKLDPAMRISNIGQVTPIQRPEHVAIWLDGLRMAGLPE